MKTEKQDRRALCKDATVSTFETYPLSIKGTKIKASNRNFTPKIPIIYLWLP